MSYPVFISCPKGLEELLSNELKNLGIQPDKVSPQGVYTTISLENLYRVALWSRLAGRIQCILFEEKIRTPDDLYRVCRSFSWDDLFSPEKTLAVVFHGESSEFRNTLFGAQVVKDAIVDFFKEKNNTRPGVDKHRPDILIHAHLKNDIITVSFDFVGYSLHQRGYRQDAGPAPLKEHIAAAMLIRSDWPKRMQEGCALQDFCCGSGTLVIEAAMMAAKIAPGLLRKEKAFVHCKFHDPLLWEKVYTEAQAAQIKPNVLFKGSDKDYRAISDAKENAIRAGVSEWISWENIAFKEAKPIHEKGLMITNPPYGVRLGEVESLEPLYKELGRTLHHAFRGWHAAILTPYVELAKAVGLRREKQYTLFNGPLACQLYRFELSEDNVFLESKRPIARSEGALMFANRLKKNAQHLQKWSKRHNIECYRLYDADLPEYAFAVDRYQDYVVLQEYAPPASVDPKKAQRRRSEVQELIPEILGISEKNLVVKTRQQQKGRVQYEKLNDIRDRVIVREADASFYVNLWDYLDTGLFLDHRPLRVHFGKTLKPGMRFLNCFSYTATASVHAALAGAMTVSVDLSKTYLAWAVDNFKLNHLDISRHQFVHYDCLSWLQLTQDKFDVIFLDPPSFSNSKRMTDTFDVQRDHEQLIDACRKLLTPGGILYFSTNLKTFKLCEALSRDPGVQDISLLTIDVDFKRHANIHRCYKITGYLS